MRDRYEGGPCSSGSEVAQSKRRKNGRALGGFRRIHASAKGLLGRKSI
jgi:hypothetical protein